MTVYKCACGTRSFSRWEAEKHWVQAGDSHISRPIEAVK